MKWCYILFLAVSGCHSSLPKVFREKQEIENRLVKGMTKKEVLALVDHPHNVNDENIWMWSEDRVKGTWMEISRKSNCLFLVFEDQKLKAPYLYKNSETSPDEVLYSTN
jgi:hypothetical protein